MALMTAVTSPPLSRMAASPPLAASTRGRGSPGARHRGRRVFLLEEADGGGRPGHHGPRPPCHLGHDLDPFLNAVLAVGRG